MNVHKNGVVEVTNRVQEDDIKMQEGEKTKQMK
jgi:hypothetical protein